MQEVISLMEVLSLIAGMFKDLFQKLDHFYILGESFSMFDFLIVVMAIDIVISALFVTFNSSIGGQYDFRSQEKKDKAVAARQNRISRYRKK